MNKFNFIIKEVGTLSKDTGNMCVFEKRHSCLLELFAIPEYKKGEIVT